MGPAGVPWADGADHIGWLVGRGATPGQRVQAARRLAQGGGRVLLEGTPLEADQAGAGGLASPWPEWHRFAGRPPVDLWAVHCAGPAELAPAAARGADLAILPAGALVGSHDDVLAAAPLPVYLEGAASLDRARAVGAFGIVLDHAWAASTRGGRELRGAER